MSQGHVVTCSASTSGTAQKDDKGSWSTPEDPQIPGFCVNQVPWKLVPQMFGDEPEYDFVDEYNNRVSDVESFVWKWSPCGRYGIDMPGGRDIINQQLKDSIAVFDRESNSWTLYKMDVIPTEIPRVCFLYWVRYDTVVIVSLVKDKETGPDDEIAMKFKQCFYYVCHQTRALEHMAQCKYRTDRTIAASYWYHIFENRRGEPFIDHEKNAWLVFSNGKDSLILLPYLPTLQCWKPKCINFDMDQIISSFIDKRVFLDPFISSHFVPWVYRNEINFFIRIDELSFIEDREDDMELHAGMVGEPDEAGMYQIRINLKDVVERNDQAAALVEDVEDASVIEAMFDRTDVQLFRKLNNDAWNFNECMTQHGKTVVIIRWHNESIDAPLSKTLSTRVSVTNLRDWNCCDSDREYSLCTIDLDSERIKLVDALIHATDVILPHPSGTMYMFRYKEDYGMRLFELPYFEPLSLRLKCIHAHTGCVMIDPAYQENSPCPALN